MSERPVGRLAPSPTGRLHLGHARSFLLAWWSVRSRGGRVVLRLEDLDRERCREAFVEDCLRDFEWLGLDWDGPMLRQSADLAPYAEACAKLLHSGQAYACVCTRAEVSAAGAPHTAEGELRYPGTCRGLWSGPEQALERTGRTPCLRLRVDSGEVPVRDQLFGTRAFDVQAEVGDFLIQRRDGVFAYQLAVVVDDARQGVTEVLRGSDLLSSAARQQQLCEGLSLQPPTWFHVPLVADSQGGRLAKRRASHSLTALRERGVDARQVVAWAARSAGQVCGERPSAAEVAREFDPRSIPLGPIALSGSEFSAAES